MSDIKILLWDIDGTVLNFEAAEAAAIRMGFDRLHLGECTDAMLADYSAINQRYWKLLERGEMTKPQILVGRFREFFAKYGIDIANAEPFNTQYQLDLGDTICFCDNAYELICGFRGQYRQYTVSNGTAIAQRKKLKNSGLEQIFDGIFISDEIGVEKPNRAFFDVVFDQIGPVDPNAVLIIGDSLTSDILGGNNAGIRTCWYNPKHQPKPTDLRIDYEIADLNRLKTILH